MKTINDFPLTAALSMRGLSTYLAAKMENTQGEQALASVRGAEVKDQPGGQELPGINPAAASAVPVTIRQVLQGVPLDETTLEALALIEESLQAPAGLIQPQGVADGDAKALQGGDFSGIKHGDQSRRLDAGKKAEVTP